VSPSSIVDRYGLVKDGGVLMIYVPAYEAVIPLVVRMRYNVGYEKFIYGPLPISYSGYESGVLPAGTTTESITFPYNELPEATRDDMFYYIESGRLIHAHMRFYPLCLRILTEIPQGQKDYSLYGKVTQSVDRPFGWFRHRKEMVFLPKIHIGWVFKNPTNMDLRTYMEFTYAEYRVEPITNADTLFDLLTGKKPYYQVTYGGPLKFIEIQDALDILNAPFIKKPKETDTPDRIKAYIDAALSKLRR